METKKNSRLQQRLREYAKSPSSAILAALGSVAGFDEFENLGRLAELSGQPAPESLSGLRQKPVRFDEVCTKEAMGDVVRGWLEGEIQ